MDHDQRDLSDDVEEFPVVPVGFEALVEDQVLLHETGFVEVCSVPREVDDSEERNAEGPESGIGPGEQSDPENMGLGPALNAHVPFQVVLAFQRVALEHAQHYARHG